MYLRNSIELLIVDQVDQEVEISQKMQIRHTYYGLMLFYYNVIFLSMDMLMIDLSQRSIFRVGLRQSLNRTMVKR